MNEKQLFYDWWKSNGCRGISYCEINYNKIPKSKIRAYLREFKGYENQAVQEKKITIMQAGCIHFPQHDKQFVSCFLKVAKHIKPDYIVLTGDIVDCSRYSSHNTELGVLMVEAQKAKTTSLAFLKEVCKLAKNVIYICGNHERWIEDKKALDISLLYDEDFTVPKVLGFDNMPIHYEPHLWEFRNFVFKHGESIAAGDNAPKAEFMSELKNGASSHTHRSGRYRHTTRTKQYVWYTTGCGCKLDMWYKLKGKSRVNSGWNHSFNVFKFIGEQFQCTQIEVIKGQCIYDSVLFKASIE